MSLLHHLFQQNIALNGVDSERTPFASNDIKAFLAVPMASAVAAQFLVINSIQCCYERFTFITL